VAKQRQSLQLRGGITALFSVKKIFAESSRVQSLTFAALLENANLNIEYQKLKMSNWQLRQ
jgi:hypothetical protein